MSTETGSRRDSHVRSLLVTGTATIGGVFAGVASFELVSGPSDQFGLVILVAAVAVELGIMRVLGIEVTDFSTKDNLYVVFMTFSMWFVAWTILLTTQSA